LSHLAPGTFALTILLAILTALGPLSTDLYLPSLPAIARHFAADSGHAQLTLSAYLVGYALGLPLYGPLSDRRGRKPILLFGLALYGVANALSSLAPTLDILILSRFFQGLGAAGPIVIARAIVRDIYEGRRAGQELARMGSIMGLVPAIAPVLGAVLEESLGWRSNFVTTALLAAGLTLWAVRKLPETLKNRRSDPFSLRAVFGGFADLIVDRRFLPFGLLAAATYAGLFAFISGSSFIYQSHFGLSAFGFALAFVVMVVGFVIGSFLSQRLALTHEPRDLILAGASLQAAGGVVMLVALAFAGHSPWAMSLPMALYSFGVGFTLPQSMAGAMMPFPDRAGAASSLLGIMQIGFASLVGAGVGAFIDHGPFVLAGTVAFFGVAALAIHPLIRRG
jgi:MFS transporter, DHA1 family, multidrug resistance protein